MTGARLMLMAAGPRPIVREIAVDTANINAYTLFGSPSGIVQAILIVQTNVWVYGTAGNIGLTIASFAAGSEFTIVNRGFFSGPGGVGGAADNNGADGGTAIHISVGGIVVRFNNGFGNIYGGGGGGGGGKTNNAGVRAANGGGGGGGRGYIGGAGGLAGTTYPPDGAQNGGAGDVNGFGFGGVGGVNSFYGSSGGRGGDGGDWGLGGSLGGDASDPPFGGLTSGGVAGYAVRNAGGATLIWESGFNPTQVRGPVG